MKKMFGPLPVLCLLLALLPLAGVWAQADPNAVGAAELGLLNQIFNGAIGFSLGFVIVVIGLYNIARNNMSWGITLVVLGVLITLTPGFFNSMRSLFCPMASALWGARCYP